MESLNPRHLLTLQREEIRTARKMMAERDTKKGNGNVPFWVLDGFSRICLTFVE